MKDIGGRVERQAGEWTGDEEAQAKGLGKQIEGKTQITFGKAKDAVRNAADDLRRRRGNQEVVEDEEAVEDGRDVRTKRPRKAA